MNREQFLKKLSDSLHKLDHDERLDILQDFDEHFEIGLDKGKTEEEIAASLGSPHHIAKELLAGRYLEQAEQRASAGNILKAVWAAIGLGFFNIVIVLGPFIGLVSIVLSGWVVGVSFVATPLLVIVKLALHPDSFLLIELFASVGLAGLGLLILIGMLYVSRWVFQGFVKYLRYNANLIKGGLSRE